MNVTAPAVPETSPATVPAPAAQRASENVALSSIYAYLRHPTLIDFPGHLAAMFFISGCNFRCGFCQNASLLGKKKPGLSWQKLEKATRRFKEDWVSGAVISGGEPTLAPDLFALIAFFRRHNFAVKVDTNGSNPDILAKMLPLVDFVAMDIKCSLERYPEFVGFKEPERIEESIRLLLDGQTPYEFRTTVLEHVHTHDEMNAIAEMLDGARRYVLQPFLPRPDLPEETWRTLKRTSPHHLNSIAERLRRRCHRVEVRGH